MENSNRECLKKKYKEELAELHRMKQEVENKEASLRHLKAYLEAEGMLEKAHRVPDRPMVPPEHPLSEVQPPEAQISG